MEPHSAAIRWPARLRLAVQEVFAEENILENARTMGEDLHGWTEEIQKKHDFIGEVRGVG